MHPIPCASSHVSDPRYDEQVDLVDCDYDDGQISHPNCGVIANDNISNPLPFVRALHESSRERGHMLNRQTKHIMQAFVPHL